MDTQDKLANALRDVIGCMRRRGVSTDKDHPGHIAIWSADAVLAAYAAETSEAQVQSGEWVMVPRGPTKAMIDASCKIKLERMEALRDGRGRSSGVASAVQEEWAAMLAAAPQPQAAEPVVWPFVESPGEIADRLKQALENGCPLLGAVRQVFIENPPLYTHPQPAQDAKDAARYRWLRDHSGRDGHPYIRCDDPPFEPMDYWITAGTADAAIDAAMAKERPNG